MKRVQFIGLDVHADTIAVAVAEPGGTVRSVGVIPNRPESIRKLVKRLGSPEQLRACYEAGPTGYVIYWQLTALGVRCEVVAPTLVPVKAGDRVKPDRREAGEAAGIARARARLLRGGPDRVCHLLAANRARRAVRGGRTHVGAGEGRRSREDGSARRLEAGAELPRGRLDAGVGPRRRARGPAGRGTRPRSGEEGSAARAPSVGEVSAATRPAPSHRHQSLDPAVSPVGEGRPVCRSAAIETRRLRKRRRSWIISTRSNTWPIASRGSRPPWTRRCRRCAGSRRCGWRICKNSRDRPILMSRELESSATLHRWRA